LIGLLLNTVKLFCPVQCASAGSRVTSGIGLASLRQRHLKVILRLALGAFHRGGSWAPTDCAVVGPSSESDFKWAIWRSIFASPAEHAVARADVAST
jgi:hypothetical protein